MNYVAMAVAISGLASSGLAQTRLEYQVSRALQEDWHSSIDAAPGESIDIRARISYVGNLSPVGLGSVAYQPTINNWDASPSGDVVSPFETRGGEVYAPIPDAPGSYGRITPFARNGISSTGSPLATHVHNISGVTYLRIALAHVTSWFGGQGNTSGNSGITAGQINRDIEFRPDNAAPFSTQLLNNVVFKFNIVLGADTSLRTLLVDTPIDGFGNHSSTTGMRNGHWFSDYVQPTGQIREQAVAVSAAINVIPAPSTFGLAAIGILAQCRRRRS